MHLLLALLLAIQPAFAGLPPTTLKGQSDTSAKTKSNFVVPFNQATDQGGINGLIETGNFNIQKDPGMESVTPDSLWTASGGTLAPTTTAGEFSTGLKAITWDSSAADQTLRGPSITIPVGMRNQSGVVFCEFKNIAGTPAATHRITAYDGTTELNLIPIQDETVGFKLASADFVFGTSGSIQVEVKSTASNEPKIGIDNCGIMPKERFNLFKLSQVKIAVSARYTTQCNADTTSVYTTFALPTSGTCVGPTIDISQVGTWATTDVDGPAITGSSLPPGHYFVKFNGRSVQNTTANKNTYFQVTDGTDVSQEAFLLDQAATTLSLYPSPVFSAKFTYLTSQSSKTFSVFGATESGGTARLTFGGSSQGASNNWEIIYYPLSSDLAITPANQKAPTVTRLTSGSGTYLPPSGSVLLKVINVAAGGGGSGASANTLCDYGGGGTGGNTTFGTSLLTSNGGVGGTAGSSGSGGNGGNGGSTTVNSPAVTIKSQTGGKGGATMLTAATTPVVYGVGGPGGSNELGQGAPSSVVGSAGLSPVANTGAGGSGGSSSSGGTAWCSGSGGGAGGYIEAFIAYPSAAGYAYAVGAAGTAGAAGSGGVAGGAGGAGIIIVEEYYSMANVPLIFGIGETVESTLSFSAYSITAGQYGDLVSIVLPPGKWSITAHVYFANSGAVTSTTNTIGISTTPGNSSAGLVSGLNVGNHSPLNALTSGAERNLSVPDYIVTPTTSTTYYLKAEVQTSITNVVVACRLTAVRLR